MGSRLGYWCGVAISVTFVIAILATVIVGTIKLIGWVWGL
jgi:hypothetical protein